MTQEEFASWYRGGPTPRQLQESRDWAKSLQDVQDRFPELARPCPATAPHLIPVFPDELDLAMAAIQDALLQNRKSKGST